MPVFDLLLKGGRHRRSAHRRFTGDVAIAGGRIAQIGTVSESDAKRVFDARDLIVAPGFTDGFTR